MKEFEVNQHVYVRVSTSFFSSLNDRCVPAFTPEPDDRPEGWRYAAGLYAGLKDDDRIYPHRVMFPECAGVSEIFRDSEVLAKRPRGMPVKDYAVTDEGGVV